MSRALYSAKSRCACAASIERDPDLGGIDRLTSAILEYPSGHCVFTCSTQIDPQPEHAVLRHQGEHRTGDSIQRAERPAGAHPHRRGRANWRSGITTEEFPACDQYTIQGDLFSRAIREGGAVPVPLEDALKNMAVIEAIFRSGESGKWEKP